MPIVLLNFDRATDLAFVTKAAKPKPATRRLWRYEDGDQSTVAESPDQLTEMNLPHH